VRAAKLDASNRIGRTGVVTTMTPTAIVTVTADRGTVWVVGRDRADAFDANALTRTTSLALDQSVPGGVATAVAYRGGLWVVAREHADLLRLDPTNGRVTARLRYLPADRAFRAPTQLATGHGSLWLLAPTRTEAQRRDAEVLRVADDGKLRARINAPSSLFVGGLAVT
jgi:hypothetical protein